MSAANPNSMLSGRAQDRLSQMHRALTGELRSLASQHSLVLGALQACNLDTQSALLQEYLERVGALRASADRLHLFISRHLVSASATSQEEIE